MGADYPPIGHDPAPLRSVRLSPVPRTGKEDAEAWSTAAEKRPGRGKDLQSALEANYKATFRKL